MPCVTDKAPLMTQQFLGATDKVRLMTQRFLGVTDKVRLMAEPFPCAIDKVQLMTELLKRRDDRFTVMKLEWLCDGMALAAAGKADE